MKTLAEIEAELTAPGAPFELVEERVRGERMRVFRERPPSLRALVEASRAKGDAEHLVCEEERLSFAEHARRVASVAAALRDRYGVGPGDRVAILAENRPEWIVTWWATVSLGAVAAALNGWWAGPEIAAGVEDADPKLLVADRKRLDRLAPGALGALPVVDMDRDFPALAAYAPDAPLPETPLDEDAPATLLYTSGTTGRPKGAVSSHRSVLCFVRLGTFHAARLMIWNAQREDGSAPPPLPPCMLVNAPLFHVSGLFAGALSGLANGLKTVWTRGRFDPGKVLRLIEEERVTSWGPMGTMAHRVVHHPERGRFDLSSMRNVGSGGAPMGRELQEKLREAFPHARAALGLGYGLTESTTSLTIIGGPELEAHPESVGRPLPSVELEIRDAEGRRLPEGAEGEIWARGPMIMQGYWRRPDATAEALAPGGWLRTGDVGRLEEGRLYVNARARDLILRGGENVYPAEIELCLEGHPEVREAAVLGADHPELGQEVWAIVVPAEGARPAPEALAAWVGARLAAFKVPTRWELRQTPLPRNATGKVLKPVLAAGGGSPFVEE